MESNPRENAKTQNCSDCRKPAIPQDGIDCSKCKAWHCAACLPFIWAREYALYL